MKRCLKIVNAQLLGYPYLQSIIINEQGIIEKIIPKEQDNINIVDAQCLDVAGDYISLGGIDLQINGGLGLAFTDLSWDNFPQLEQICNFLWQQGIDGFLPTIVTTSLDKVRLSLDVIDQFIKQQKTATSKIIGVHLEGPFLNYHKRGAHPAEYLLPLELKNVKEILTGYEELIKIITLAPELDETGETISYLHSLGIIVSLGHSIASAAIAKKAFNLGASMVTHAFNGMPSLHHREPGLLGEAMINPTVYCGLIADGKHVCPTMIKILLSASNYEQGVFLVSDALAPIGLGDGLYPWDSREIEVKNGTAQLKNGTLAGTTLSLLLGVENLLKWNVCSLQQAIAMATESPRKAIGLPCISIGQPANLLHWHYQDNQLTWQRI